MVIQRDYHLWQSNFGLNISLAGTAPYAVNVPEPSTMLMLITVWIAWMLRRHRVLNFAFAAIVLTLVIFEPAEGQLVEVSLRANEIGSDPGLLTSLYDAHLVEYTLNDPFSYDPNNSSSTVPYQAFFLPGGAHAAGMLYHGNAPSDGVANLFYNLDGPFLSDTFVLDIWGRNDACCKNRDNDFDVLLRSGGFGGGIIAAQTGLALSDDANGYRRVTFNSPPSPFDTVEVAGHHAYFTLAEVRAATKPITAETSQVLGEYGFNRSSVSFIGSQSEDNRSLRTWLPSMAAHNVANGIALSDMCTAAEFYIADGPDSGLVVPGIRSSLSDFHGALTGPRGSIVLNSGAGPDWDAITKSDAISRGNYLQFAVIAEQSHIIALANLTFQFRLDKPASTEMNPRSWALYTDDDDNPANGQSEVDSLAGINANGWIEYKADLSGLPAVAEHLVLRLVFFGGDGNGESVHARVDDVTLTGLVYSSVGDYSTSDSQVPEPSTLWLLAMGVFVCRNARV